MKVNLKFLGNNWGRAEQVQTYKCSPVDLQTYRKTSQGPITHYIPGCGPEYLSNLIGFEDR